MCVVMTNGLSVIARHLHGDPSVARCSVSLLSLLRANVLKRSLVERVDLGRLCSIKLVVDELEEPLEHVRCDSLAALVKEVEIPTRQARMRENAGKRKRRTRRTQTQQARTC